MTGFTVHDDGGVDPATHALVVGAGRYPHLLGGSDPVPDPDGMGQLSSPPVSARKFAAWLLSEYTCPGKPLGSLSLLLSEDTPAPFSNPRTGAASAVAAATIQNIMDAVRDWKRRGDSHDDNRLIFYFCGHGVSQGEDMSLLASDVFADTENAMNGALDFRTLMKGLGRCRATQQVFFVDACRASSDVLIERCGAFAGQVPLAPGDRPPEFRRRLAVPYYATLAGDRSHGRPHQVSLFTEALLKGLRGAGADDPDVGGPWVVTTTLLLRAISHFMSQPQFAGAATGVQVPNVGEMPDFELNWLAGDPVVPVYVRCPSEEENRTAAFVCRRDGVERQRRAAGDGQEWSLELEFGQYEFEARLGSRDVRNKKDVPVRPAYRRLTLEAAP